MLSWLIVYNTTLKRLVWYFIFFSVCEQVEFNKSCNLIGSGRGRNFPIRP